MNRKKLISAVERIAAENGYTFHATDEREMSHTIRKYPIVWLVPPIFNSMQGRKQGKITYSLTLHAMEEGANLPPAEREQVWAKLEEDILGIFSALSNEDFVIAVEDLKIRPTSHTFTTHGEICATATADIITFF